MKRKSITLDGRDAELFVEMDAGDDFPFFGYESVDGFVRHYVGDETAYVEGYGVHGTPGEWFPSEVTIDFVIDTPYERLSSYHD